MIMKIYCALDKTTGEDAVFHSRKEAAEWERERLNKGHETEVSAVKLNEYGEF